MEGCKRGNPCIESWKCGAYHKEGSCTNCTFEECEQRAHNLDSFAFSYGISLTEITHMVMIQSSICLMCNEFEFLTRGTVYDTLQSFGIYRGPNKGKFLFISLQIII